jgi:hypothetical protein
VAPLYNALRYERSVRKQLENQVLQLQRDLLQLTTVVATMRGVGGGAYQFTPNTERGAGEVDESGGAEEWKTARGVPGGGSGWRGEMF